MAYRISTILPITEKTTHENAKKWLNIVRYNEYGTVIQFQDDCEYRIEDIIGNKRILQKFLGPYYRKYLLRYIPIDNKDLLSEVKTHLIELCNQKQLDIPKNITTLKSIVDFIGKRGYEIGLLIGRINKLLDDPDFKSLLDLEYVLENSKNLSVILFSEIDITYPKYKFLLDKASLLFDHLIYYSLYDEKDCLQFISYNQSMWKTKLLPTQQKEIIRLCGGYLWLISHIQRFLRDNPNKTINDVLSDDGLQQKITTIWEKLSPEERSILTKISSDDRNGIDNHSPEYNFLKKTRLLVENNGICKLGVPLLKFSIEKEKQLRKIYIRKDHIYVENTDVTYQLTKSEQNILLILLANRKKIIPREILAYDIWKDNWEEKYSDWALDRLIYRLRNKLDSFGIAKNFLKTIKKKGFIFG